MTDNATTYHIFKAGFKDNSEMFLTEISCTLEHAKTVALRYGVGKYNIYLSPLLHEKNQNKSFRDLGYGLPEFSGQLGSKEENGPQMYELMRSIGHLANKILHNPGADWDKVMDNLGLIQSDLERALDLHYKDENVYSPAEAEKLK